MSPVSQPKETERTLLRYRIGSISPSNRGSRTPTGSRTANPSSPSPRGSVLQQEGGVLLPTEERGDSKKDVKEKGSSRMSRSPNQVCSVFQSPLKSLEHLKEAIILDFQGIPFVDSSFADEFLGKLVSQIGVLAFCQRCTLLQLTPDVQVVLERAISLRVKELFETNKPLP